MERAIEDLAKEIYALIPHPTDFPDPCSCLKNELRSFAAAIASDVRAGIEVELRETLRKVRALEDRTQPLKLVGERIGVPWTPGGPR